MRYGKNPLVFGDSDRENWIHSNLKNLPSGSKILDAGAGQQPYRKWCEHLEYHSQDACQYDGVGNGVGYQSGEWNTDEIEYICDITSIPVERESFDAVLCVSVLEHVLRPEEALMELTRVLRRGGRLILTAPFSNITH